MTADKKTSGYVRVSIHQAGYIGPRLMDQAGRLILEAQVINAQLGVAEVDVDEAFRQLRWFNERTYASALKEELDCLGRTNPRRWLAGWRLRKSRRWLDTHPEANGAVGGRK